MDEINKALQDKNITGVNGELFDKQDEIRKLIDNLLNIGSLVEREELDKSVYVETKKELEEYLKKNGMNGDIYDYIYILTLGDIGATNYYLELEDMM